ncbi:hypothetical protein [Georgenia sp. H159]|uniref:hypothetical protein n=1 Tax=Georgenia sp. H159 TaxID=3076115 RepID=UPI002D7A2A7C|nr:hypothetical protein [Georgenia sp. H159]
MGATAVNQRRLLHGGFAFFSEVLLTGMVLCLLSVPLVTLVPALAAGAAHLRRHLEGRPDTLADLWADVRGALRSGGWLVSLAIVGLLVVLDLNSAIAASGVLPGGTLVQVVSAVVAGSAVVVVLRATGSWSRQRSWRETLRSAALASATDPAGSALLLTAVALCGVMVWMLTPLVFIVPGLLCLAVVAVEYRAERRA